MRFLLIYILFAFAGHLVTAREDACRKSTEGKEFWFGFMENRDGSRERFVGITVTSRQNTTFQLFIGPDEERYKGTFTVNANDSRQVKIPWKVAETLGSEKTRKTGIHLVAQDPVNVYALNWDINSADVAVIYPVGSLGKTYYALCYNPDIDPPAFPFTGNGRNSEFLIVATEDDTHVEITPSKVTDQNWPSDTAFVITLDKGEVYQVQSENELGTAEEGQGDLTGSFIQADKPVAFFSGSLATRVPNGQCCWDHLYEQIPPVQAWGKEYFTVPLKSRLQDRYRVMAAQNNTTVYISGREPFTLDRGGFEEFILSNDAPGRILGDKPILVAQYSQSNAVDSAFTGGDGDPFMTILSTTEQTINDVTFIAYQSPELDSLEFEYSGIKNYYINIIAKNSHVPGMVLDSKPIDDVFTTFPGNNEYSYAQMEIEKGTHRLRNLDSDGGFLAYVYGYGGFESYGYGAGFKLNLTLDIGESPYFEGDTLVLCHGETKVLDAGPFFENYLWNTPGDTTQAIRVDKGGWYYVTTTTIEGCVLKDSVYVMENEEVVIDLGGDQEGCRPYTAELSGSGEFEKYIWQNPLNDTISTTPKIDAAISGVYKVTVFDEFGCAGQDSIQLTVYPAPDIEIRGPELVCGESETELQTAITNAPDSVWNYANSFNWSSSNESSLMLSEKSHTSVKAEVTEWGEYEIYYRLTTIDDCEKTDTFSIRFYPDPSTDFDFTAEVREGCQPLAVEVNATSYDPNLRYFFFSGSSFLAEGETYQTVFKIPGKYDMGLIIESTETGCTDTLIKPDWITVHPNPVAGFDVNYRTAMSENSEITFINKSKGADYYTWLFGDETSEKGESAVHTYLQPGEYISQLIAETRFGCRDTALQIITILQSQLHTPNAFRPESPVPENRTFMPITSGVDNTKFNLKIYNRWGELVYETNSPERPWNGKTHNNRPAPAGNYVWISNYTDVQGTEHERKGQVLLLR